jgi:Spy/CpxP family protein refolding chaperone
MKTLQVFAATTAIVLFFMLAACTEYRERPGYAPRQHHGHDNGHRGHDDRH